MILRQIIRTPAQSVSSVLTFSAILAIFAGLLIPPFGLSRGESPVNNFASLRAEDALPGEHSEACSDHGDARVATDCDGNDARFASEMLPLGPRGALIARAREQSMVILRSQNACSAWFQEANPQALEVLRSLHYELDDNGTSVIDSVRDDFGTKVFKHPWGARANENAGSNSMIRINSNGPFFIRQSRVADSIGPPSLASDWHVLTIGPYVGDTPKTRITMMLHELAHIIGRIPEDDDSWNGRSSQNTAEILRHCKKEIDFATRKPAH
jgi:hypothetical protein